jgi:hypothetical protein
MPWIRWSIAIGALVLLVSFAVGTEDVGHVHHRGQAYSCGHVLSFDHQFSAASVEGTPADVQARCGAIHTVDAVGVWGGIGLGALAILVGWTASRERDDVRRAARRAHLA